MLCSYQEEYVSLVISSDEIKAIYYHSAKGLINNFCAIMMVENLEGLVVKYIKGAWTYVRTSGWSYYAFEFEYNHGGEHLYMSYLMKKTPFFSTV